MSIEINLRNQNERSTASQIFIATLANFTGIASGAAFGFTAIIMASTTANKSASLNYDQISWIASIIFATNLLGCCIGGIIADAWGRKHCLLLSNAICFLGWILIVIAYYCIPPYQFIVLIIGRLITGFSIGTANVTNVVYTTEISNINLRPMFTTWSGLFSTFGILLVYLVGYFFRNWATVAIIISALPLISFISIIFCLPESPTWLNSKEKLATIDKSFEFKKKQWVQLCKAEETTNLLEKEETISSKIKSSISYSGLMRRTCLIPAVIVVSYFFFLNFSGYYIIVAYATDFVNLLKIPLNPYLTICSFAIARLIGAIFISIFSKSMGRRFASIISGVIMTISIFSIVIYLRAISTIPDEKLKLLFWIPTILMWIFILACLIGFGTIPFAMAGEIFPLNIRGIASGITVCLNSLFTFLAIKTYPFFLEILGIYHLLIFYGSIALIGTIFIILFLPETKGKSLQEIENYFANCNSLRTFRVLK